MQVGLRPTIRFTSFIYKRCDVIRKAVNSKIFGWLRLLLSIKYHQFDFKGQLAKHWSVAENDKLEAHQGISALPKL